MDAAERSALRSRNDALRTQIDSMLEALERQQEHLGEATARLSTTTAEAWSADGLVRVTVNAAGVPIGVHLDPESFKRSRPDRLGASVAEAAQAAARAAAQLAREAIAPLRAIADEMPDLSDLVPGAPSLKDLLNPPTPGPTTPEPANTPGEDSWGEPILRTEIDSPRPVRPRPSVADDDDDDFGGSILRDAR
jgi:DNA-binding protein YbaB